jgi:hypothetical protein
MMASARNVRPESERIAFLLRREGYEKTRMWVERTAAIYREALAHRGHYACDPAYRPLFEKAAREFEEWLRSTSR